MYIVSWEERVRPTNVIDDPALVELHAFWRSRCAGDRLPSRRDIDPPSLGKLLQWVFLIDVGQDPLSFRYRLIGTGITRFLGRDFTGRMIDEESYGDKAPTMRRIFLSAIEKRGVTAARGRLFYVPTRSFLNFCCVMMPLSSDGDAIDMLFCGYAAEDPALILDDAPHQGDQDARIVLDPIFLKAKDQQVKRLSPANP